MKWGAQLRSFAARASLAAPWLGIVQLAAELSGKLLLFAVRLRLDAQGRPDIVQPCCSREFVFGQQPQRLLRLNVGLQYRRERQDWGYRLLWLLDEGR